MSEALLTPRRRGRPPALRATLMLVAATATAILAPAQEGPDAHGLAGAPRERATRSLPVADFGRWSPFDSAVSGEIHATRINRDAPLVSRKVGDPERVARVERVGRDAEVVIEGATSRVVRLVGAGDAIGVVVADLDGDGLREIAAGFADPPRLMAFDATGAPLWVARLPAAFDGFRVLDDGDGFDDVFLDHDGRVVARVELLPEPGLVFETGAPLRRIDVADFDRDGRLEAVLSDRKGLVRVFDQGRFVRSFDVGAPIDAFASIGCDDDSFLPLDAVVVAGGALKAYRRDGTLRFETPCAGAPSNLSPVELRGGPPAEIVVTTFDAGRTTLRALATDGVPFFEATLPGKMRQFSAATLEGDARRRLTALPEDGAAVVVFDAGGDGSERRVDFGAPIRTYSIVDVDHDGKPNFVVLTRDGEVRVAEADGSQLRGFRPEGANVAELRVLDADGDDRRDVVCTLEGGAGIAVCDAEGRVKARIAPGPKWRGASVRIADLDGDGPREWVLIKEDAPKDAPRRTLVAAFAVDGRRRFETAIPGGRARHTTADVDADGKDDFVVWTDAGFLRALGPDGFTFWRAPVQGPIVSLRATDFDRDGAADILLERPNGRIEAWWPPPRDRRPRGAAAITSLLGRLGILP